MIKKTIIITIMSLVSITASLLIINNNFIKKTSEHELTIMSYNVSKDFFLNFKSNLEKNNINVETYEDFQKISDYYSSNIKLLQEENEQLNNRKEALIEQKEVLKKQYEDLLEEERKKKNYIIDNVEALNQYDLGFPNGCESVALTILLHYYEVNVSVNDVVSRLKKGDLPHLENNILYGGNPYIEFIGNPANKNSYGVYDDPIIEVANSFKEGIIKAQGMSLDEVLGVVKQNRPVLVWTSNNMAIPYISQSWIYKPTAETINWMKNLHALVVIGRTDTQVIVSDPINGKIRWFDKDVFESRYNAFGKRALYY